MNSYATPTKGNGFEADVIVRRSLGDSAEVRGCTAFASATTHPLWKIDAGVDGHDRVLILKELTRGGELDAALGKRPDFVVNPDREPAVYRSALSRSGLIPAPLGCSPPGAERPWILLDLVSGVELWQIEDPETWRQAARALAEVHLTFGPGVVSTLAPDLVHHDAAFYARWGERARAFTEPVRSSQLAQILAVAGATLPQVMDQPRLLLHGECFASNVLVSTEGRCLFIDWEMAGLGPAMWDLAALVSGWDEAQAQSMADAYWDRAQELGAREANRADDRRILDACRLQQAIQWLGWSATWLPPEEHRKDWLAVAADMVDRLRS